MNSLRNIFLGSTLVVFLSFSASAQIAQDKPELCGKKNQFVPLPANISATQGDSGVFSTLFLKAAEMTSPAAIRVTMGSVDEVCPISQTRLVVFGNSNPATSIAIVDQKAGKLIDWFYAYDPAISPNQHWLVLRDFYPPQSEVPFSEEYLLYDLSKDKSGNLAPNLTPYTADTVGRVIYPAVDQNTPFEHSGLPQNQTHQFRSDAFYWSDDSQTLVFADSVQKVLFVVLVMIEGDQTHPFIHTLTAGEACEQGSKGDIDNNSYLMLSHAQAGSNGIELQFRSSDYGACKPVPVLLNRSDFVPAEPEVHIPPHRKDHSTLKQQ